jgi:hypothetical protein
VYHVGDFEDKSCSSSGRVEPTSDGVNELYEESCILVKKCEIEGSPKKKHELQKS